MTARRRGFTISVLRDGNVRSSTFHMSATLARGLVVGGVTFGILMVLGLTLFIPIARQAARVPFLESRIKRMEAELEQVRVLAATLDTVEATYAQFQRMIGVKSTSASAGLTSDLPTAPPIIVVPQAERRQFESGVSQPTHWPLTDRGFVTRGQVADSSPELHPGIDVAVPIGTIVLAAGGGTVLQSGNDPEYGQFVLIQHADRYQSMYGHLSRILVRVGETVQAGQVLGGSGNTGRSTAPHLHFEIRHDGTTIDPMTLIRENR